MNGPLFKSVEECKADARVELKDEPDDELYAIVRNQAYHYWFRDVAREIYEQRHAGAKP
jgi:hypothetical protein